MLLITFLLTVLYGFLSNNKSRFFWMWCVVLLAILMCTSDTYADLVGYEKYYAYLLNGGIEFDYLGYTVGWYTICKIAILLHLSCRGMLVLALFLSCFIMHRAVRKLPCRENTFWALFLVFPALVQCVQMRFFLATAIVFYGFTLLIVNIRRGWVGYLVSVVVACCIHASCAVYIILIFVIFFRIMKIKKAALFSLVGTVLLYSGISYIPLIAESILPSIKYKRYFVSDISVTTISWTLKIVLVWLACVLIVIIASRSNHEMILESHCEDTVEANMLSKITMAILMLVITLPLLTFDANFHRFIEIGYEFCYIIVARFMLLSKRKEEHLIMIVLCIVVLCFAGYIYIPYNTIILPFFSFDRFISLFY